MTASYRSALELADDRARWAVAMLGALVQDGRARGWLDGQPSLSPADPAALAQSIAERSAASEQTMVVQPMTWLAQQLELGDTELDALWLLVSIEHDPLVARLATATTANNAELSLQVWRRITPISMERVESLQRLGLIELDSDPRVSQHRRSVRASDRIVEIATGELRLDPEVAAFASIARGRRSESEHVASIVRALRGGTGPVVVATGPEGAGRTTLLERVAAELDAGVLRISSRKLASEPVQLQRQLRAIARECCLLGLVPLFRDVEGAWLAFEDGLSAFEGPIFVTAREPVSTSRPLVVHEVALPTAAERSAMWRSLLPADAAELADAAGAHYSLRPGAIVAAARNAMALGPLTPEAIHEGIRAHLGEQLGANARRIVTTQTWADLVLPPDQLEQVAELVARVKRRQRVLEDWGFGAKIGRGTGVAALMSGPPGTGKTMVAGLIANELGLDLYQVDLSKIVSKYIGETEKQLGKLFDAAETGQAIILFDEADSLFAKRSEVKSSNDRYANLEVNYLLQRLEQFTGIVLLTTNHERSIDEAFRRRLATHIRFALPDETERQKLWKAMLPAKAEIAGGIDFGRLARDYEMSGGYVKNAVLRAAFVAADEEVAISMRHLWSAARTEYEAMGKIVRG